MRLLGRFASSIPPKPTYYVITTPGCATPFRDGEREDLIHLRHISPASSYDVCLRRKDRRGVNDPIAMKCVFDAIAQYQDNSCKSKF